jgi:hypothetical protein
MSIQRKQLELFIRGYYIKDQIDDVRAKGEFYIAVMVSGDWSKEPSPLVSKFMNVYVKSLFLKEGCWSAS